MLNEKYSDEERFYNEVALALGTTCGYRPPPYSKLTRWNNRQPGNGRFPGFGIVRRFSSDRIHLQLHNPTISGVFDSEEAAFQAIRSRIAIQIEDQNAA